jgi:hypothetical protein
MPRKILFNLGLVVLTIAMALVLQAVIGPDKVSAGKDEVCICHAAGQEGTTHFVTVCANRTAIFGQAGHFNEDGTPRAGHEQDYLGPCSEPSPPPSPAPSSSPEPEPSPSPGL